MKTGGPLPHVYHAIAVGFEGAPCSACERGFFQLFSDIAENAILSFHAIDFDEYPAYEQTIDGATGLTKTVVKTYYNAAGNVINVKTKFP